MNLHDEAPVARYEDRTGWTQTQQNKSAFLTKINPLIGLRNMRSVLVERGMMMPVGPVISSTPIRFGLPPVKR